MGADWQKRNDRRGIRGNHPRSIRVHGGSHDLGGAGVEHDGVETYIRLCNKDIYDCAASRVKQVSFTWHTLDGQAVARVSGDDTWISINPQTLGDTILVAVCNGTTTNFAPSSTAEEFAHRVR